MTRYINSFFITLLIYCVFIFTTYQLLANKTIVSKKTEKKKIISLNHIKVNQKKPIKNIEPKKTIKPKPEIKEKKKVIKNKAKKKKRKILKKSKPIKKLKPKKTINSTSHQNLVKTIGKKDKITKVKKTTKKLKTDSKKRYLIKIRSIIKQHTKYPKRARKMSVKGIVKIKFTILRTGSITNIKIVSGHRLLNKSAIKTIQNASKYFPKPKENIDLQIPIEYKLK